MFFLLASAQMQFTDLPQSEMTLSTNRADLVSQFYPNLERNTRVSFNEQAANLVGAFNRAQQAYHFERFEFADSYEQLGLSGLQNDNYQLIIESEDNLAVTYAVPNQDYGTYQQWSGLSWVNALEPLYSYVSSVVYFPDEGNYGNYQVIVCVSKAFGTTKPSPPIIIDDELTCASDTDKLR